MIYLDGRQRLICETDDYMFRNLMYNRLEYPPQFTLANYSIHPPDSLMWLLSPIFLPLYSSKESVSTLDTYRQVTLLPVTSRCHLGIMINLIRNNLTSRITEINQRCLCPPSHYGPHCEYQNQRVSITVQLGCIEWQTPFTVVFYLVDNTDHVVQSYHKINYVSSRDCDVKFSFHLLYSSRPKQIDRRYSVRIDAFETIILRYRASWLFAIDHFYLPVYRLSIQLTVPHKFSSIANRCPLKCRSEHSDCVQYVNKDKFFCRCHPGWSGPLCTESIACNCSPDSVCVGSWNNQSICVCPLRKFGPRCFLSNPLCEQKSIQKCQNRGQCIPRDLHIFNIPDRMCLCPTGFRNELCQTNESEIRISFASLPDHSIPESVLLHFITVNTALSRQQPSTGTVSWGPHERMTAFKRIPFNQVYLTVYWGISFHLLFAEYYNNIYLLFMQTKYEESKQINVSMDYNFRCSSIRKLLNHTIVAFPISRRVKYYHIPCRQQPNLACLHDEDQFMCLCTYDRRANCFSFDHRQKHICRYESYCQNGGQCFQNDAICPMFIMCQCPKCFFGTYCHLSTKVFDFSLDAIFSYRIRSDVSFGNQPSVLKITGIITLLIFIIGICNGILSILVFKGKSLHVIGCGIYLLTASIISIPAMTAFMLKFVLLVLTQSEIITNRSVLTYQCISVDFAVKAFLQIGDWLYACVAAERLFSVIKEVRFKKGTSRTIAKWIILLISCFVIGTSVHEPYHRALLIDEEEQRVWCVIRYPEFSAKYFTTYTSVMTIIHTIGPFTINLASIFGIIILIAQRRIKFRKQRESFGSHFLSQLEQYKYSIISAVALVLLSMPRIIIAYTVECMKSPRDPIQWFLVAYFISFLPPALTLIVFVLPSEAYRNELKASMKSLQGRLQRWISFYK